MTRFQLTWNHYRCGISSYSSRRSEVAGTMRSLLLVLLCCGVALAKQNSTLTPPPEPDSTESGLSSTWSTLVMVLNVVLLPSSLVALTLGHIAGLQLPFPRLAWYRTPYSDTATICGHPCAALSIRALQAWMMMCWALLLVMYAATEKSVPKFFSFAFTPFCVGHGCMMLWISTRLKQLQVLRMQHQPPPPEIPDIPMHEAQLVVVLQPDFDEDRSKPEMTDPNWYWNGLKGVSLATVTNPDRIDQPIRTAWGPTTTATTTPPAPEHMTPSLATTAPTTPSQLGPTPHPTPFHQPDTVLTPAFVQLPGDGTIAHSHHIPPASPPLAPQAAAACRRHQTAPLSLPDDGDSQYDVPTSNPAYSVELSTVAVAGGDAGSDVREAAGQPPSTLGSTAQEHRRLPSDDDVTITVPHSAGAQR